MHMTVIRIEPQVTQYHKKFPHVQHKNCELKHATHRLVQHTLQIIYRWHGQMKAIFFGMHCR